MDERNSGAEKPFRMPEGHEKPDYVRNLFDAIASHYDLLNDLMSLSLHRHWKRAVVELSGLQPGGSALDLCTGTGDIALALARRAGPVGRVVGLDFSPEMLVVARRRQAECPPPGPVEFRQGDALAIPFAEETFDCVTVGYGLRNLADIPAGLREMRRVVRPGGRMVSLDLGKPTGSLGSLLHRLYLFTIVPRLGGWISGQRWAYTYLPHSLADFPAPDHLKVLMNEAGWRTCTCLNWLGGIAAVHVGVK